MSFQANTVMASASNSPRTKVVFFLKFTVKYCQNIRCNNGFRLIGLVMLIDGRNDNSRLVRAKNSLWDDSNHGFLKLGIFFSSWYFLQRYKDLPKEIVCSITYLSQCKNIQYLKVKCNWEHLQKD